MGLYLQNSLVQKNYSGLSPLYRSLSVGLLVCPRTVYSLLGAPEFVYGPVLIWFIPSMLAVGIDLCLVALSAFVIGCVLTSV